MAIQIVHDRFCKGPLNGLRDGCCLWGVRLTRNRPEQKSCHLPLLVVLTANCSVQCLFRTSLMSPGWVLLLNFQ